jgi:hypothetical protein
MYHHAADLLSYGLSDTSHPDDVERTVVKKRSGRKDVLLTAPPEFSERIICVVLLREIFPVKYSDMMKMIGAP